MNGMLRLRVGVPGHGRKMARLLGICTVSQTGKTKAPLLDKDPTSQVMQLNASHFEKVINYGVCHETEFVKSLRRQGCKIFNDPALTDKSSNKLTSMKLFSEHGVPTLEWTTNSVTAVDWAEEGRVYCRRLLRGKKGAGIVVASNPGQVVHSPLYTKEFPTTHEYRVHVVNGVVIDWVEKKRSQKMATRYGLEKPSDSMRNRCHGYVFAHTNRLGHEKIREAGLAAINAVGLDYGAADILAQWAPKEEGKKRKLLRVAVCEVNTAPGMSTPSTLEAYRNAFERILAL